MCAKVRKKRAKTKFSEKKAKEKPPLGG